MARNNIAAYLRWITPTPGDPTYSLLRAHLLFEQLIDAAIARTLPHPSALADARLTFSQKLAIVKAATLQISPSHWTWQALARLNKLRNALAHGPGPKLDAELRDYVAFCVKHSEHPLPESDGRRSIAESRPASGNVYTAADMVTLGLYISLGSLLGFDIKEFVDGGPDSVA